MFSLYVLSVPYTMLWFPTFHHFLLFIITVYIYVHMCVMNLKRMSGKGRKYKGK